jgi:geranylgeranyl diphosphate synthase type II
MRDLETYLRVAVAEIDQDLDARLQPEGPHPAVIWEAMRYSVFAGGKRIRPVLTLTTADMYGKREAAIPVASALEMIHTYSLIHDDLPAMDNDDWRRGRRTNHKVFGEAVAILAGDALLTRAFETLADSGLQPEIIVRLVAELARASGVCGMIGGQAADIQAERGPVSPEQLQYIHAHKTGALLTASVIAGATVGVAPDDELALLRVFAQKIGLAYQIVDDLLNVVGDFRELGKATGTDAARNKLTYPAVFGLHSAREMVQTLTAEAKRALSAVPRDTSVLEAIADYLVLRNR